MRESEREREGEKKISLQLNFGNGGVLPRANTVRISPTHSESRMSAELQDPHPLRSQSVSRLASKAIVSVATRPSPLPSRTQPSIVHCHRADV